MDKDALYLYLKKHFDIFKTDRSEWLEMAKEAYGFYHGLQWDKETEQALCCKGRPALTFNHIKPLINFSSSQRRYLTLFEFGFPQKKY